MRLAVGRQGDDKMGPRTGLSLIEVLITIFVLSIGLLGVVTLVPVAHHQARQGVINDHAAYVGRNQFRDFRIRNFTSYYNWFYKSGEPVGLPQPGSAFCIDPRYVAATTDPNPSFAQWMPRVTVFSSGLAPLVAKSIADELFVGQDDLSLLAVDNPDDPPEQIFQKLYMSEDDAKRQSDGQFSWLATAVFLPGDTIRLSLVVFHQRSTLFGSLGDTSERTLEIEFTGGGLAGGAAMLRGITDPDDFELAAGQWIMVANQAAPYHFRWYRVASVGIIEEPQNRLNVMLEGPDRFDQQLKFQARATIVEGVVAVYEKIIHVDSSSQWDRF